MIDTCRCTRVLVQQPRELYPAFRKDFWLFGKAKWGWAFMSTIEASSLKGHKEGGDGEGVLMSMIQLPTLHM